MIAAGLVMAVSTACSSKSEVDLQKPATPSAPAEPGQKADPSTGKSGTGAPTDPADPSKPSPSNPVPQKARYRLLCEAHQDLFSTVLTTAQGVGGYFTLFLGNFADATKSVTRENFNLTSFRAGAMVPGAFIDHMTLLFVAKKLDPNGSVSGERFYTTDVDVLMRTGRAESLGAVPTINSGAVRAISALGLSGVNYGASDQGTFVLLPDAGGFKVLSRDRLRSFGTIPIDSSRALFPKIYEKEKLFSALYYDGNGFHQVLKHLSLTASSVSVSKDIDLGAGSSAAPLQRFDASSFAWSESTLGGGSSLTIARVDLKTLKVTRAIYQTGVAGASLFPQVAFLNEQGKTTIYVAVEKVASITSISSAQARVDYAKLQLLSLTGAQLHDEGLIEYPQSAIDRVMNNGRKNRFIIQTLLTTAGADEMLASFDDHYGFEVYKDRGGYMDPVAEEDCLHPTLVQDTF